MQKLLSLDFDLSPGSTSFLPTFKVCFAWKYTQLPTATSDTYRAVLNLLIRTCFVRDAEKEKREQPGTASLRIAANRRREDAVSSWRFNNFRRYQQQQYDEGEDEKRRG